MYGNVRSLDFVLGAIKNTEGFLRGITCYLYFRITQTDVWKMVGRDLETKIGYFSNAGEW